MCAISHGRAFVHKTKFVVFLIVFNCYSHRVGSHRMSFDASLRGLNGMSWNRSDDSGEVLGDGGNCRFCRVSV